MYSSYSGPLISCRRAVGVCCLASSCNENGQQVRTQLDKLHFEADTARAKANRARSRLIRLSEAAEMLQRQALTCIRSGRENDARDLLVRKKKVMQALENSKRRIDLLDELSAKLNEAISLKENQLVNAVTADVNVGKEVSSHDIHIVPPKEEIIVDTVESEGLDMNFLELRNESLSQVHPDCQAEQSSTSDTKDPEGTLIMNRQSETTSGSSLREISSYENFLEHLDQQLNNIEEELDTFLRFSNIILEGEGTSINLKLQQAGEILEGVSQIRKRCC
ncbi:hypothetical protein DCAR_0311069 [Daucus carota subsp. sativus]|uniref:Uncharacterized protein n=1 Tax=Daucus carota subsp. sativus TaxID=79200 RepID=A0AAF1ATI7_DAUCS|nr:hypothetical protein DCAR_0311069 [Daucus carota subsp. sativus]